MTETTPSPTGRIEALISLTGRLTALMALQCKAFEDHRPQDAAGVLEELGRLANLYRRESAEIRANPALLNTAPAALRARLAKATEAFDAVLARQGRAVGAAKTVTEGLVRAIAEEVESRRAATSGYGPAARPNLSAPTAIALNRRA